MCGRESDKESERQTDRQTNRQTDRQAGRQIETDKDRRAQFVQSTEHHIDVSGSSYGPHQHDWFGTHHIRKTEAPD